MMRLISEILSMYKTNSVISERTYCTRGLYNNKYFQMDGKMPGYWKYLKF